jgi:hypothetical protein
VGSAKATAREQRIEGRRKGRVSEQARPGHSDHPRLRKTAESPEGSGPE